VKYQQLSRIRLHPERHACLLESRFDSLDRKAGAETLLHPGMDEGIDPAAFLRMLNIAYENAGPRLPLHPASSRQVLIRRTDGIWMHL
jgi:hypothetical protein